MIQVHQLILLLILMIFVDNVCWYFLNVLSLVHLFYHLNLSSWFCCLLPLSCFSCWEMQNAVSLVSQFVLFFPQIWANYWPKRHIYADFRRFVRIAGIFVLRICICYVFFCASFSEADSTFVILLIYFLCFSWSSSSHFSEKKWRNFRKRVVFLRMPSFQVQTGKSDIPHVPIPPLNNFIDSLMDYLCSCVFN